MPEFAYIAKNSQGARVAGTIAAVGVREALASLARQSLFPVRVEAARQASGSLLSRRPLGRRVKAEQIAANLSQLADLLQGGVPLLKSLDILAAQATNPTLREVLTKVRDDVADGAALDEAMADHPRVFGELIVGIVRAGSAGAFLEDALQRTAGFLQLQEELKHKVKGAMAYPVFLAVAGMAVTVALIVFFVPKFAELFAKLESQGGLPWPTMLLLWMSETLNRYGLLLAGVMMAAVAGCKRLVRTEKARRMIDLAKLQAPLFSPIFRGYAAARFCRVLGTLLRNGVPLLKSLEISSRATANRVFAEAILASAENISTGDTLSAPLAQSGLFSPPVMAMISVAEEANNLDHVLLQIADRIERRNEQQLEILVRLLEPMLLLIMGAIMLFVILALLLPVFEMSSTIG